MSSNQPIEVFPTIGATSVNVDDRFIYIGQHDYTGNGDRLEVDIPRSMLLLVLEAIFSQLSSSELTAIASTASLMASKAPRR